MIIIIKNQQKNFQGSKILMLIVDEVVVYFSNLYENLPFLLSYTLLAPVLAALYL